MDIGARIRAARKAAGISQEELARRAGMSLKGMSYIERGHIEDPHYSSLRGIAAGLGLSVGELLEEPELDRSALGEFVLRLIDERLPGEAPVEEWSDQERAGLKKVEEAGGAASAHFVDEDSPELQELEREAVRAVLEAYRRRAQVGR